MLLLDRAVTVTPPPAAKRLAAEALLSRTFTRRRRFPPLALAVDVAAGRRVRAWDVHQAVSQYGLTPLLGGESMHRAARRALGL